MKPRVCFFARVSDPAILDRVEFYANDLRILREAGYDVVVVTRVRDLVRADFYFVWWWTWAFAPIILARVLRRPVIVTGVFDEWMFDRRPIAQRVLLRFALRAANASLFISRLEARVVPARFPTTHAVFAPCVVDGAIYAPQDGVTRDATVLTVAWLQADNARRKGIDAILRAAALVRVRNTAARFVIAGERGNGYPELQALAEDLGVTDIVEFRGVVTREEKVRLMGKCGVYLQPSVFEGFGVAVLEAMSCGAAVVTSAGGALPEVVGDAGVVLGEPTPAEIADAVCDLLADPPRAHALGTKARQRAFEHFSYAMRRDTITTLVRDALAGGAP